MPGQPHIAIAILNYNGSAYLKKFLNSVISSDYTNKSVFVVDNASTDDSIAWIKSEFPSVNLILLEKNHGYAGAYNHAFDRIEADYYLLLNTDVEVPNGFISPVISLMQSDPMIGICQPKILSQEDKKMFEYSGAAGGWLDLLGFQFARGRIFHKLETDNGQYNGNSAIFWACGACLFIKSEIFHKLNGFYEFFFMQSEETDLCWRAGNAGYKVYCCGESVVFHIGGAQLRSDDPYKTYLNMRNNMIMLFRNLSYPQSAIIIPIRLIINVGIAFFFLLKGQTKLFRFTIKSQLHFLKWLFFNREKQLPSQRGLLHLQGVYKSVVLWDYLVKRKSKFSDIVKPQNN